MSEPVSSLIGTRPDDGAATWPPHSRTRLLLGLKGAVPIAMGYVPIGLAMGVLAARAGLSPLEIGAMSVLVYAGASQFIGVGMLAAGFGPLAIALTTLLVNLRHVLMSAALSPYMSRIRRGVAAGLAFFITDESFAVSVGVFRERGRADVAYMVGLYGTAYASWVLATVGGAMLGGAFAVPDAFALDFALPAMFIGLLAGQLREKTAVATAVAAAVIAVAGAPLLGGWTVMVASVGAAAFGAGVGRWMNGLS